MPRDQQQVRAQLYTALTNAVKQALEQSSELLWAVEDAKEAGYNVYIDGTAFISPCTQQAVALQASTSLEARLDDGDRQFLKQLRIGLE
jgi:hypothetical protein